MAASNRIEYEFTGQAAELLKTLDRIEKEIKDLPTQKTTNLTVSSQKAMADLEAFRAEVESLPDDHEVNAHLNTRSLRNDIRRAQNLLRDAIPDDQEVKIRIEKIDTDVRSAEKQFDKFQARLDDLKAQKPEVIVQARTEQAQARLQQYQARLDRLAKVKKITTTTQANTAKAQADIARVTAEIEQLGARKPQVVIDAEIALVETKMEKVLADITRLEHAKATVHLDVDQDSLNRIGRAEDTMKNIRATFDKAGQSVANAAAKAAPQVFNLGSAFSSLSSQLRRLGPLLAGSAIAILASLLPALLALGAGFGGAIAGAGALAAALGGTLIPAITAAVGILGRLTAVMDVFKLRQQAQDAALKGASQSAKEAATEESTLRNARRALGDATRTVQRAETDLQAAREQARTDIADAEENLADARRDQVEATRQLADAEVQAYQEIRQAVEDATDAVLAYKQAKLDSVDAKLDTRQAQLDLAELKDKLGATGDEFENVFKKFTKANADMSGLSSAIEKAATGTGGSGKLSTQDQIDLERAIQAVRQAKLNEKKATDSLGDSQIDLNEKQREAARLQRSGIAGVDSYRTAVSNLADANDVAADAQKDYNDLLKKGVEGAAGVVAAHQALGDAQRNAARQAQDLISAQKQLAAAETSAETAMDVYKEKRKKLTDGEKGFLDAIVKFSDAWTKTWKIAAAPVISALTAIVNAFTSKLPSITGPMTELTAAWGAVLLAFGQDLKTPQSLLNLKTVFDGLKSLSVTLGDSFRNVFATLGNVAAAAMPFLVQIGTDIKNMTARWREQTGDIGKLRGVIAPLVTAFKGFVGIVAAVGDAIVSIFLAGNKPINEFINWIKDGIKSFARFAKSAKGGDKIKQFFEDTLPLAKSIIKFLVLVGKVILKAFQFAAPILKPFVDSMSFVLEIINFLLDLLLKIPTPIRSVVGWILSFFIGLGKVTKVLQIVTKGLQKFPSVLKLMVTLGKKALNTFLKPFRDFFSALWKLFQATPVKKAFRGFLDFIKKTIGPIIKVLKAPFAAAWKVIKVAFEKGVSAVGKILRGLGDVFKDVMKFLGKFITPFKNFAKKIADGFKDAFRGVKGFVKGVFDAVIRTVKGAVNIVVDGINVLIKGVNKLSGLAGKVPGIPNIGKIPEIPHLAQGGVTSDAALALIGEAGREAVLPLTDAVYRELATAIVKAMQPTVRKQTPVQSAAVNAGTINRTTTNVGKIEVTSPPGTPMDPVVAAVKMARVLERRGGGSRN